MLLNAGGIVGEAGGPVDADQFHVFVFPAIGGQAEGAHFGGDLAAVVVRIGGSPGYGQHLTVAVHAAAEKKGAGGFVAAGGG